MRLLRPLLLIGSAIGVFCLVAPIGRAQGPAPGSAAALYGTLCANCHGATLQGGQGPSLVDAEWKHGEQDEDLARVIREGVPGSPMAAFRGVVTEEQIRALVIHLREFQARARAGALPAGPPPFPARFTSERHGFRVETVVSGLDTPWGLEFLPDRTLLVTERPGQLRLVRDGVALPPVAGLPRIWVQQDGGLLDVAVHPRFADNQLVYLAFSEPGAAPGSSSTRVIRGRLSDGQLIDQQTIFQPRADLYWANNTHFGARLLFDATGALLFSLGDRGRMRDAQDLASPYGKLHRVLDDGRTPPDNPFVGRGDVVESIWSYGHRNQQGLAFDPRDGRLWSTEHGPRGGDELNVVEKARNYGWPLITHGMNDNGTPLTAETARDGLESPVVHWTPSIAVSAITFYEGSRFPGWRHHLLLTALNGQQLRRLEIVDGRVVHQEVLFRGYGRVRDVAIGPDGLVYLAMNNPGRVVRLVPD